MRLLVVSDTWGARFPLKYIINLEKCDRIVFLGDYVSDLESLDIKSKFPPYIVRGECDSFHNRPFEIITTISGYKFYMVNGYVSGVKEGLDRLYKFIENRDIDCVFYGCTKKPKAELYNKRTWFITPGSFGRPEKGDKANYAIVTIGEFGIDIEFREYKLDRVYD